MTPRFITHRAGAAVLRPHRPRAGRAAAQRAPRARRARGARRLRARRGRARVRLRHRPVRRPAAARGAPGRRHATWGSTSARAWSSWRARPSRRGPAARASSSRTARSTCPSPDASCDRVVSTYVLDLLSPADARAFVAEARRVLRPGGLLALASLAPGRTAPARLVTASGRRVWRLNPALLGGCRPLRSAACSTRTSGTSAPTSRSPTGSSARTSWSRAPPLSACRLARRRPSEGAQADGPRRVPHARPRADRLDRRLPRAHRRTTRS